MGIKIGIIGGSGLMGRAGVAYSSGTPSLARYGVNRPRRSGKAKLRAFL